METTGSLDCALGHRVEEDAEHEISDDARKRRGRRGGPGLGKPVDVRDVQDRADEAADGAARDDILAAPELFGQILYNLTENAIKYTPDGGTIHVKAEQQDDTATITVKDNGIGIAPDDLPRIFDRFYRVDKARARKSGGNGIGLSLVKFLVELFGGTIEVTSQIGEGTTFTLTFPLTTKS